MLQKMLLTTIWGKGILLFFAAGVLLRMITVLSYKRMQYAAENPGKTKRQWVQLLKKRYESYEKFGRIKNVEVFVEHYFFRKGILGIPLSAWDRSIPTLSIATGLIGFIGAGAAYNDGEAIRLVGGYLLLGTMAATGLFLLHILGDTKETKRQIVCALTDYLANGTVKRGLAEGKPAGKHIPTKEEIAGLSEAAVTEEERVILEEVLEEYFWEENVD